MRETDRGHEPPIGCSDAVSHDSTWRPPGISLSRCLSPRIQGRLSSRRRSTPSDWARGRTHANQSPQRAQQPPRGRASQDFHAERRRWHKFKGGAAEPEPVRRRRSQQSSGRPATVCTGQDHANVDVAGEIDRPGGVSALACGLRGRMKPSPLPLECIKLQQIVEYTGNRPKTRFADIVLPW